MSEAKDISLSGKVFHKLRDDILNGRYKNHEELREMTLSEELGVSRTPVREALRQLGLEGLVEIIPNRGAYVNAITAEDVEDIYRMRSPLEGLCARRCCSFIPPEKMEEMEENVYLAEFHAAKGHGEQLAELDHRFHEIMYESCSSRMLSRTLLDFHEYVMRARKRTFTEPERSVKSIGEHRQIMEAIRERDPDRAEQLATRHVMNAYENMVKNGLREAYRD